MQQTATTAPTSVNSIGTHYTKNWIAKLIGSGVVLFLSMTVAIMLGPVQIDPVTVWKVIGSHVPFVQNWIVTDVPNAQMHIVWDIRMPRVLLSAIVGAGLSIVGIAIQALIRNPLADPYILGVSSGASVGATAVLLFGSLGVFGSYALSLAAFLGALASIVLVFLLSLVGGRVQLIRLLLAGIAVSIMLSALTSFFIMLAPRAESLSSVLYWMMGSFTRAKWESLVLPTIAVIAFFLFLWMNARNLNLLILGEETSTLLGLHPENMRKILLITISLVTGLLVAVSGSIGFVGLMLPHIFRLWVGSDHRRLIPLCACGGAIFMVWADVLARLIIAPEELPIGIVTALCGGPFFIWLLRRRAYTFGGS
ncbi:MULTISPECIES: FecCD family ABC transporter permease [Brevibacillus]|uniref:FecCD family ABC transporter permease n=1 Tax=Brevibacillus TaxID=55080 RepID=UPI000367A0F6|nr:MULTISPECIES: iron chelate uptake ABC transporter family permease subunit [Brevibacillus]ATO51707.1 ABC transporter permease [Brevibacillus laterosporus DSM 25]AYB37956.1 iron ABC transporter permease [Brevibacillus laterosporus]MBG9773103.1 ABC transporter permease [Brevibacillus laterosporus]MBG9789273.1 ABC transporter permease [Brevibacillus laterosporus]MBG9798710.1 ABC transporter permease [Brevibacillus laterosporus]